MLIKYKSGFTLIELMISVSIMVILMAIAAPNYSSWMANTRIRNAAENANVAISLARTTSLRTNSTTNLTFSNDGSWQITDTSGNILMKSDIRGASGGIKLTQNSKACSAGLPPASTSLIFNGSGSLTTYNSYTLDFERTNAKSTDTPYTVIVSPGGSSVLCMTNGSSTNPQSCQNVKGGC